MLDFLTFALCAPYSETTDGTQFDVLLEMAAANGRIIFKLFQVCHYSLLTFVVEKLFNFKLYWKLFYIVHIYRLIILDIHGYEILLDVPSIIVIEKILLVIASIYGNHQRSRHGDESNHWGEIIFSLKLRNDNQRLGVVITL